MRYLLIALVLAGCATEVPEPTAEATPIPTPEAGYTDAEQLELLREGIDLVYGTDPRPEWYPTITDMHVEDGWAYVVTQAPALADVICAGIAAVTYDDDAEPIGVDAVMVFDTAGNDLADCDTPD